MPILRATLRQSCRVSSSFRLRAASSWNWSDGKPKKQADAVSNSPFTPLSVDAEIQKQVLDKCTALHSSIMPLNEKVG
jgi:hypothetical protein